MEEKEIKHSPEEIYRQYEKGVEYKSAIRLYDNCKLNQEFFFGNQWDGVVAPDIEKPVINIVRQAIDYYISMLVSDDIGIQPILPEDLPETVRQAIEYVVTTEMDKVIEDIKFKAKCRDVVKNAALDGDHQFYFWFNSSKNAGHEYPGGIDCIGIDSTNLVHADPTEFDVERQEYILIVQKLPVEHIKKMLKANKKEEFMTIDEDSDQQDAMESYAREVNKYGTVITKFYRADDGFIHAVKTTKKQLIKDDVNLMIKHYPIARMGWRKRKNSYHGESPITPIRPNQIMINKYYMMINEWTKKMSFPKILFDKTKIASWTNRIEAIGVNGDVREAFMSSTPNMQLGSEVIGFLENLIQKTKDTLGIFDAALGNARPENTSAIIAIQKAASQPLELQKMDYYDFVESSVRIMLDLMAANYGVRNLPIEIVPTEDEIAMLQMTGDDGALQLKGVPFDFAEISSDKINLQIDVGASAYWSEIMQIQTLDNMFRAGIIPDAKTYIEQMPNGIVKSKQDILDAIERKEAQVMQQQMMAMQMGGVPGQGNPV